MLVWWCHQLFSRFLADEHLPRVSCQLRLANNDNEVKPEAMHNVLAFTSWLKEIEENSLETVQLFISNEVSYFQIMPVRLHSTSWREKENLFI